MKTLYSFLFIILFSILITAQENEPKQLTNFDFDARNPVFMQYPYNIPWYIGGSEIYFEAVHSDSLISISSLKYDEALDSFYQFTEITPMLDSNIINRKAAAQFIENYDETPYKILLWETNENGNWDIAFSIDSGNGWIPYRLLFSSLEDELDPSFIVDPIGYNYNYQTYFRLLYSAGNSVFICSTDSLKSELLFEGNDSLKYSKPAGAYSGYDGDLYVVVVKEEARKEQQLVYRKWNGNDGTWSEINTVFERAPSTGPKFVNPGWGDVVLSFEVIFGERKKKILLIHPEDFGIPGTTIELLSDPTLETSDFSSFMFAIVTKNPEEDFYTYAPFSFRFRRNDSTYVRIGTNDYYYPYSDFYSRVINSKPALGPLRYITEGIVSYTIWEDSTEKGINLFGLKRIDPYGDVEDESGLRKNFTLSQNYPNPFNPTTNIEFRIANSGFVSLKVYDVLGREIATLVNEEKSPGEYEVEFDASQLSSGIYFYKLQSGDYSSIKKMIYLK